MHGSHDEKRHAELAWRFVRWAIAADPSLSRVAARTFAAAVRGAGEAQVEQVGPDLSAHGLASASLRREIVRHALAELVCPCAEALCAPARPDAALRGPVRPRSPLGTMSS